MAENGKHPGPGSTVELFEMDSVKKTGGWYISKTRAAILAVVVVGALVAVGLGVHFGKKPCPTCTASVPGPEEQWEKCKKLAADRGECLCNSTSTTNKVTGLRLNKTLIPSHYNVELKPDVYLPKPGLKVDGHVEIWMTCEIATDIVVMHMSHVVIYETTIEFREAGPGGRVIQHTDWAEDKDRHFLKLYLPEPLTVGTDYYFRVEFHSSLDHSDLSGFYVSSYKQDNETRYLAVTQFQRSHARRAFPCFDEPGFKSKFNITLVRKANYSSISNMEIIRQEDRADGYTADVYNTTVRMPAYLLAFVVSDFVSRNYTTQKGTFFRHWCRRDYADQLDYGLSISGRILETFENYTGVPYPLTKTDQIAVPDFRAGAMENWGLVTYRERILLWNKDYCTMSDKRIIAAVVAHELAHKWWGNLVTCDWWDDTFLNEAFATYFSPIGVAGVHPNWEMEEDFMRSFLAIMEYDGYTTSQPIRLPHIEHHDDTGQAFNTITYNKGASVLRMINYFLGHDTFRKAMNRYLSRHAFQNVKVDDLFTALQEQAVQDNRVTWDTTKKNISTILQTWLDQQGHPVVTVTDRGHGKYFLSQEHFLYDYENKPKYESKFGFTWDIPFTHSTFTQLQSNDSTLTWIYRGDMEVTTTDPLFILANYLQQGFFRVNYEDKLWTRLIQQLNTDHTVFSEINRGQLVADALNLAVANKLSEVDAMKTTEYLNKETKYLPWFAFNRRVNFFNRMFYNTETYESWQRYLLGRATPNIYTHVGWDDSNENEHHEKYLRTLIIFYACSWGSSDCRMRARQLYYQFMQNDTVNPIFPNVRSTVYCEGIRAGGSAEWDFAYRMYEKNYQGYIGREKSLLQNAMTCSRMSWILKRYLQTVVEWKSTSLVQQIARNPVGQPIVTDFLKTRWNDWPSGIDKANILTTLTSTYSTKQELAKFENWVKMFPDDSMKKTYDNIRKTINKNIEWMEKNEKPLRDWFTSVNNKQTEANSAAELTLIETSPDEPHFVQL